MMKPLQDQARRVVAEGRSADVPLRGSQERNWQALVSRLDAPLPNGAAAVERSLRSGASGSVWSSALVKLALWGALFGAFAGGLALYGRDVSARTAPPPLTMTPVQWVAPAAPLTAAEPSQAPVSDHADAATVAQPVRGRVRRTPPTASGLAAETRLIAQAQSALNDGAAARALSLLDQHRAGFPHGELVPEREAARVLALCALGRTAEAKAARARFERYFSSSPLLARVRAGCVSAPH